MIIQGRNLIVYMSDLAIASSKSCDIDVKVDTIGTASPTTGDWKEFRAGRKEWSIGTAHLLTEEMLYDGIRLQLGSEVKLSVGIRGSELEDASVFQGILESVPTQASTSLYNAVSGIYWLEGTGFVGKDRDKVLYYLSWPDMPDAFASPSSSYIYAYGSQTYRYNNGTLVPSDETTTMTGTAIVTHMKVSARWGSLASASIEFKGTSSLQ